MHAAKAKKAVPIRAHLYIKRGDDWVATSIRADYVSFADALAHRNAVYLERGPTPVLVLLEIDGGRVTR